jgi:hypothetical protein
MKQHAQTRATIELAAGQWDRRMRATGSQAYERQVLGNAFASGSDLFWVGFGLSADGEDGDKAACPLSGGRQAKADVAIESAQ